MPDIAWQIQYNTWVFEHDPISAEVNGSCSMELEQPPKNKKKVTKRLKLGLESQKT